MSKGEDNEALVRCWRCKHDANEAHAVRADVLTGETGGAE